VTVRLHVVGANLFAGNRTPHAALDDLLARPRPLHRRPAFALGCEGNNAWPDITKAADRHGYDAWRAGHATKGAREVFALTHRRVDVHDVWRQKVADGLDSRIAPDRWALTLLCTYRGIQFSATATHWHASLQAPNGEPTRAAGSAHRVRQAADQTAAVAAILERARDLGFPPIVFADCNMRATPNAPSFAPSQAFPEIGVAWESETVDGIGHDTRAFTSTGFTDFPVAGTDHRGGRAGLRTTLTSKEHR
jgi:hypothetical protein